MNVNLRTKILCYKLNFSRFVRITLQSLIPCVDPDKRDNQPRSAFFLYFLTFKLKINHFKIINWVHDQSWPIDIPLLIHLSSFMSIEATLYVRHSYLCPMQCLNHLITVPFRYLKRAALCCNFIQLAFLPYLHTFIKMTLTAYKVKYHLVYHASIQMTHFIYRNGKTND